MNISNYVPFTLFYLWRTNRLPAPIRFEGVAFTSDDERLILPLSSTRILRDKMRNVSRGTHQNEDVGFTILRDTERKRTHHGHILVDILNTPSDDVDYLYEWRITATGGTQGTTVLWAEHRAERISNNVPKYIVRTDRGWQTIKYFMDNPHLRLYRPLGELTDVVSNSNYREVSRENLVYSPRFGYYDASVMTLTSHSLEDKRNTFHVDGYDEEYLLSQVVFRIPNKVVAQEVRSILRSLVKQVLQGRMTEDEATQLLITVMKEHILVKVMRAVDCIRPPHDLIWRGYYMESHILLPNETARVVKAITAPLLTVFGGDNIKNCRYCSENVYLWNPHESIEMGDSNFYYCNEDHALRDTRVFKRYTLPEKYSYHTNVLNTAPLGRSHVLAPHGDLRRVGIELECYHEAGNAKALPKSVTGGTMFDKLKGKKAHNPRPVKWNAVQYKKWGAIPTRDGSLSDTNGVEWVFRPSDLIGLQEDVSYFLSRVKPYLAEDATARDQEVTDSTRTYGLHVHVTSTDTMNAPITRARMTVVGTRLAKIIQAVGRRGYSNYTRAIQLDSLLSIGAVKDSRLYLKDYVTENNKPSWMKYVAPYLGSSSYARVNLASERKCRKAKLDSPRLSCFDDNLMSDHSARYNMINIRYGKPTIELRHAKSIANTDFIMLNAELSQAVILFATYHVMSIMQCSYDKLPKQFAMYVAENNKQYPRLATWLAQQDLSYGLQNYVVPQGQRPLLRFGG